MDLYKIQMLIICVKNALYLIAKIVTIINIIVANAIKDFNMNQLKIYVCLKTNARQDIIFLEMIVHVKNAIKTVKIIFSNKKIFKINLFFNFKCKNLDKFFFFFFNQSKNKGFSCYGELETQCYICKTGYYFN